VFHLKLVREVLSGLTCLYIKKRS